MSLYLRSPLLSLKMSASSFKYLFSFRTSSLSLLRPSVLVETKRLDLPSDAPIDAKFKWIYVFPVGEKEYKAERLEFVSMSKDEKTNEQRREFLQGSLLFDVSSASLSLKGKEKEEMTAVDTSLPLLEEIEAVVRDIVFG